MSDSEDRDTGDESGDGAGDERLTYREWATALQGGTLLGQICSACGHITAAPKAACAQCGSRAITTTELDGEGEVYSVTTVAVAPEGFESPYEVALIDLGAGRVLGRIDGTVAIGDRVRFSDTLEAADGPAPVFEPTDSSSSNP
jgi:uncharacterized protein